jgi:hypothetical protein
MAANAVVDIRNVVEAFEFWREIIRDAVIVYHDALVRKVEFIRAAVRIGRILSRFVLNDAFVVVAVGTILALTRGVTIFAGAAASRGDGRYHEARK